MKTVIIGGGKGGQAIIELAAGPFLRELVLEIVCVVDPDQTAPGLAVARERGIPTSTDMIAELSRPGIELVIELTGRDDVLEKIYKLLPPGVRLIDHTFAHIFWDLVNAQEERERRLEEITTLEGKVEKERWFLQSVFDTIPELVVVLNPERRIIRINASFARMAGVSARGALGKTCQELLSETELAAACREMAPLLETVFESGLPRTAIWQTAVPKEAYWEVTFMPVLNENLEIEAVVGTWHRITEQIMLRREIESAEQKFRSFIDSAHDWISIKDREGRYVIVNPVCARSFHLEPQDFVGKLPADMLPPERVEMITKHDAEVIRKNRHQTYDEVFEIDGRDRHYQTVRFPLTDYSGATIGVCTIARDITPEIELRDQVVQAARLAAVGKLAAGVAHEINNPLTGVLAYAEDILEDLPADHPQRDEMQVIIRETMRCRDIVRNLLDFARQETLNLEKTSPEQVVSQTLNLVHRLPQFRNITIEERRAEKVPPINCDVHQMQQVILNLMMNAADAMHESGRIIVSTAFERRQNQCIIEVEDSGPGIPENLIDKIFEPFFSTKGTNGLGLAVSWGIVERHRGTIEVDTAEGGGAIFRVVLPAAEAEESA